MEANMKLTKSRIQDIAVVVIGICMVLAAKLIA